jgi:hypothetical protein
LTPEEKRLYGQLFRIADAEQIGVITGAVAVEFFKKSRLSPAILAEVRLLQNDVYVDMDDCGYGQSGISYSKDMVYCIETHCSCSSW